MKKYFLLFTCVLCVIVGKSQNCNLTDEQQIAVDLAKHSIAKAEENKTFADVVEVLDNCSKALKIANNCSDIYYFYKELYKWYTSFAYSESPDNAARWEKTKRTKLNDENEIYYYQQAIFYCEEYINVIQDGEEKEAYKRRLKSTKDNFNKSEQRIREEQSIKDNEDAYRYAINNSTIESYRLYLSLFPNGSYANEIRKKLENLIIANRCAEDNQVFAIAKQHHTIGAYKQYLEFYPDACNAQEAKNNIEELAFYETKSQNTIAAYMLYVKTYPNSKFIDEAQNNICKINANEQWNKIKNSSKEYDFQNYINTYGSCINNKGDAENQITNIRYNNELERGKQYSLQNNFIQAKETYLKTQTINNTQEVRDSLRSTQRELDYGIINEEWLSGTYPTQLCEEYLLAYPNEKYSNEVTKILCSVYFMQGVAYYSEKTKDKNKQAENRTQAQNYFETVIAQNCQQADSAKKYLKKIAIKNKITNWNTSLVAINSYSTLLETNNLSGYENNILLGISVFRLQNKGVGGYFSYRATNNFYIPKKELNLYPPADYNLEIQPNKTVSSVAFSVGLTKKIFRPVFCYFGVGTGMNTIVQDYSATNLSDLSKSEIKIIDKANRDLLIAPEFGLTGNLWGVTLMTGIKYPFSLNKTTGYQYKGLSYQVGIGFGITDMRNDKLISKKAEKDLRSDYNKEKPESSFEKYKINNAGQFKQYKIQNTYRHKYTYAGWSLFASVGMDFGYPDQNLSLSPDEMIYNKSYTFMMSLLQTKQKKENGYSYDDGSNWGLYLALTANPFFFYIKETTAQEVFPSDFSKTSKALFHIGPTVKIAYPIWLYFGGGVQYTSVYTQSETTWVRNNGTTKLAISPQAGIMFNLWRSFISIGIDHPIYLQRDANNSKFNPRLSLTIGGGWLISR